MKIKIAIGCHTYLLGEGLKRIIEEDVNIEVIKIFNEGIDIKEIVKLNPDIIIADFNVTYGIPENFTLDNKTKILLIGDRPWRMVANNQIPDLISKGVVGILPPGADSDIFKKAIMAVASGDLWIDSKIIKNIFYSRNFSGKKLNLTYKEQEIVALICKGYRNKEIAQKINVSEQTVKSHCNRIFKKFGVSDRLQLAVYYFSIYPD